MRQELNILNDFTPTSHENWLAVVEKQLKGKPFEKALVKKTYEGIAIQPMYFKHDLEGLPHLATMPGFVPYIRGISASGNRFNAWRIAQQLTEPDPAGMNAALVQDLKRGQNAINILLDRASMSGRNPAEAPPEDVGTAGLSLATTGDMATVFENIDLFDYPVQFEAGLAALPVTALLAAFFKSRGQSLAEIKGAVGYDPVKTLAHTGELPISLDTCYDEMASLTHWAGGNAPGLRTLAVDGAPYRNAGGNAVHEIGFAAATGVGYIREMLARGLAIDVICPRIQFHLSIGPDFFMEIAKFRAVRMVWHNITRAFGAGEASRKLYIHASTMHYNKTRIDPWVNMLRVTTEAFSGIAGGCDSLHVGPFDELFQNPNDFSRRIARNVQILLREEAHFNKVVDPAGGSWYVENITLELAKKAWDLFQEVEAKGGIVSALKEGVPQKMVAETAARRAKNVATRKDRIVGTNMYPNLLEQPLAVEAFDFQAFQDRRGEQVAAFVNGTGADEKKAVLKTVSDARGNVGGELMASAVDAATAGATLGELTHALRPASKGLRIDALNIHRAAEPFENLRRATEAHVAKTGTPPQIFMANMGPLARHKPRSDFATAFFNVAAFETIFTDGFAVLDEAVEAVLASGTRAVVICGTDDDYMEIVPPLTGKIKAANPDIFVIVAGYSSRYVELFREAGVDEFIHLRANALAILEKLQQHLMQQPEGGSR